MTRWMHASELQRPPVHRRLDPLVEGACYHLPLDLLRALWQQACADATDGAGRRDDADAGRRFHQLAALAVACGGRLRPDVGAVTRVDLDASDGTLGARRSGRLGGQARGPALRFPRGRSGGPAR